MVAPLDDDLAVGLEDVLVEDVLEAPVHPVGPQVAHEVADQLVREEVFPRAIGHGGQARLHEGPAEHDAVEVARVGGHHHQGAPLGQGAQVGQGPLHADARRQILEGREAVAQVGGAEEGREPDGQHPGGEAIDPAVEVTDHIRHIPGRQALHLVAELAGVHLADAPRELLPGGEALGLAARAALEAVDLLDGGVVEDELVAAEGIPLGVPAELLDDAGDDLLLEVGAVGVEVEERGLHGATLHRSARAT